MRVDADCRFCFLSESANHFSLRNKALTKKKWKKSSVDFKAVMFTCDQGVRADFFSQAQLVIHLSLFKTRQRRLRGRKLTCHVLV
jgi:hypothetical protein